MPMPASGQVSSCSTANNASRDGGASPKRWRRLCSSQQKMSSLSVLPTGMKSPSSTGWNCGRLPLCANTQYRPHSSRMKGCVFSSETMPCVALRICAMTLSEWIGQLRTSSAIDDCAEGCGSRNRRTPLPSKKAMPQPSAWTSVSPPRFWNPVKEKQMSVGVLQFMPNSWHIAYPYLCSEAHGQIDRLYVFGQAADRDAPYSG